MVCLCSPWELLNMAERKWQRGHNSWFDPSLNELMDAWFSSLTLDLALGKGDRQEGYLHAQSDLFSIFLKHISCPLVVVKPQPL